MDPVTALIVGIAALVTAAVGAARLRRETPDLNESRLLRNVDQLEDMLATYEKDRARFLQELERERGKVETLEHELESERQRAKTVIEEKQAELDRSLRKIAILEHKTKEHEETISTLRRTLNKHLRAPDVPEGGEVA